MTSALSAICVSVCLMATTGAAMAASDIEEAMLAYEKGNYVFAESRFRAAAESGDLRAAEVLGFMYAIGAPMYPGVTSDPVEAAKWLDVAAREARPAARYLSCALSKRHTKSASTCFDRDPVPASVPVGVPASVPARVPVKLPVIVPANVAASDADVMEPCWGMQFNNRSC